MRTKDKTIFLKKFLATRTHNVQKLSECIMYSKTTNQPIVCVRAVCLSYKKDAYICRLSEANLSMIFFLLYLPLA